MMNAEYKGEVHLKSQYVKSVHHRSYCSDVRENIEVSCSAIHNLLSS